MSRPTLDTPTSKRQPKGTKKGFAGANMTRCASRLAPVIGRLAKQWSGLGTRDIDARAAGRDRDGNESTPNYFEAICYCCRK